MNTPKVHLVNPLGHIFNKHRGFRYHISPLLLIMYYVFSMILPIDRVLCQTETRVDCLCVVYIYTPMCLCVYVRCST